MSKKLLAVVIVGVIVIVGLGAFFVLGSNKDDKQKATTTSKTTTTIKKSATSSSGNVFSLAEAGKAQKCTFTYSGSNGNGTGNMYSDGKGRALMTLAVTSAKGNTLTSNTLLVTDKVYTWTITNGQTIGFVANKSTYSSPPSSSSTTSSTNSSSTSNSDVNKSYKINCSNWSVDESMLTVPTNVNFQTLPGSSTQ